MEILRKVKVGERLPEDNSYVYCDCIEDEDKKLTFTDGKWRDLSGNHYTVEYWYEPVEVELKSTNILPLEDRTILKFQVYKSTQENLFELLNKYHKALEAAELELISVKDKISKLEAATDLLYTEEDLEEVRNTLRGEFVKLVDDLMSENQGLKLAIEKNHGVNCIIAPQSEVDKVAKERYEEALESIPNTYELDKPKNYKIIVKALKIAAYGK